MASLQCSFVQKTLIFLLIHEIRVVFSEFCKDYAVTCTAPQRCCDNTCCIPPEHEHIYRSYTLRWSIWNMWYFWFIVIFILMSCFGGCGYYRRRQLLLTQQQTTVVTGTTFGHGFFSHSATTTSRILPSFTLPIFTSSYDTPIIQASRPALPPPTTSGGGPQGHFPAPPPYSEVVSKAGGYSAEKDQPPPYPGAPQGGSRGAEVSTV